MQIGLGIIVKQNFPIGAAVFGKDMSPALTKTDAVA